jgi:hypothetical protein
MMMMMIVEGWNKIKLTERKVIYVESKLISYTQSMIAT